MFNPHGRFIASDTMIVAIATVVLLILMAWRTVFIGRTPEFIGLVWVWFLHFTIAAIISAPIVYFGRTRVQWSGLDVLMLILPFAVWIALMNLSSEGKSIANLIEPVFFSFAIPLAVLARLTVGNHLNQRACSISLVGFLCLIAFCVYLWSPSLPE
jgi:hypothetical protein